MKKIEFDDDKVAKVVDMLIRVGNLWSSLNSPLVYSAFEQTVRRLGGRVRIYPELKGDWDTDLELAIYDDILIAKLPHGNAEVAVRLDKPHRLLRLHDRYFHHEVPITLPFLRYDVIWDFAYYDNCRPNITTITTRPFERSLRVWAANRNFEFVGGSWCEVIVNDIIHFYERLACIFIPSPITITRPARLVLAADVELPTKDGNTILFPQNVVAGYWAKQFALAAAMVATI